MKKQTLLTAIAAVALISGLSACKKETPVPDTSPAIEANQTDTDKDSQAAEAPALDQLDRKTFNQTALRMDLPLFWMHEDTPNNTVRPEILTTLNFYPTSDTIAWKDADGKFTQEFYDLYQKMVANSKNPFEGIAEGDADLPRIKKVAEELNQASVTAIVTDMSTASEDDVKFVKAMLKAANAIDKLYATQTGADRVLSKIPANDIMSKSMARRNWGIMPMSPRLSADSECRALAGVSTFPVGVYPESLQNEPDFCAKIAEQNEKNAEIFAPFTVVIEADDGLTTVPYSEFFKQDMTEVSNALKEAADVIASNPKEMPLNKYLRAAAESFLTNDWNPADEAWAAMNSTNSAWYVRCAPDETYWEPCSRKAGFHLTFARINPDALAWQEKLTPLQQEMEERLAKLAGAPYKSRTVSFHLPDFIDIITNSGDDRDPYGATIGQSLPNWGPVANEGRGRTVAMNNLYTDPDSLQDRQQLASSMFVAKDMELLDDATGPGLLSTILHEATHNLGPAHEYTVNGKVDDDIFGGELATLAEEFKAQTASFWFLPFLVEKGVISQDLAKKSYADSVYWAFNQISQGMKTADGHIKPYPQLAAIQVGFMLEKAALKFDPEAMAANGTDKGAFSIDLEKMPEVSDQLMKQIAQIKAKGDKKALVELQKKYIEGTIVPFDLIQERMLRLPKASFVYSVKF